MVFLYSGMDLQTIDLSDDDTCINVHGPITTLNQFHLIFKLQTLKSTQRLSFFNILWNPFPTSFFLHLSSLQNLTRFELCDSPNLGIDFIVELCKCIGDMSLTHLNVSGLNMGQSGGLFLVKAIKKCKTIECLKIRSNKLQMSVGKLLALNLKYLDIGQNDVHNLWWKRFLNQSNSTLLHLNLTESRLDDIGFMSIKRFFSIRPNFVSIDLSHNPLTFFRIQLLCQGLLNHASLSILSLRNCNMRTRHFHTLCAMLTLNQSIEHLSVDYNPRLSHHAYQLLIASLQKNYTLLHLGIDSLYEPFQPFLSTSRIPIHEKECYTGHVIRLLLTNQDLKLKTRFWSPKFHHYYPIQHHQKLFLLILVLRPYLPMDLILHLFSFWYGIQPR